MGGVNAWTFELQQRFHQDVVFPAKGEIVNRIKNISTTAIPLPSIYEQSTVYPRKTSLWISPKLRFQTSGIVVACQTFVKESKSDIVILKQKSTFQLHQCKLWDDKSVRCGARLLWFYFSLSINIKDWDVLTYWAKSSRLSDPIK